MHSRSVYTDSAQHEETHNEGRIWAPEIVVHGRDYVTLYTSRSHACLSVR